MQQKLTLKWETNTEISCDRPTERWMCLFATNRCRFHSVDHKNYRPRRCRSHECSTERKIPNRRKVSFRCAFKSTLNIKRKMRYLSSCVLKTRGTAETERKKMQNSYGRRRRDWTSRLLFVVCEVLFEWHVISMKSVLNAMREIKHKKDPENPKNKWMNEWMNARIDV